MELNQEPNCEMLKLDQLFYCLTQQHRYYTAILQLTQEESILLLDDLSGSKLPTHQILTSLQEKQQLLAHVQEIQEEINLLKPLWLQHQHLIDDRIIAIRLIIKDIEGLVHQILTLSNHSQPILQSQLEVK